MTKTDEQMSNVIRLLAGREVELEDAPEGDEREQYVLAPEVRSDADVNLWIRRKAGRS